MSFVEIQEFADGYFFTQIFTSLRGRDMHRLLDSFIGRNILDFTIFLRDINGAPWKHVTLLEKPDDLSSNYFESLFPLWFRGPYLSFIGNGLSTQGNIAEFCGSIISPGQRPTPQELIEVLNFKKFIAHVLEKTENCRKFGLKFVEEHNNLHESIYLLGKEMGFKGGSWCIFPTPRNSTIFEENVTSIKTLFSNLLGNLFGPDPTTAWKDIWRMSLRISPDNVMIKLSNTYSSYFDDHKKYGYDVEHHELWFYRRDTQVRNVFRTIAQHANFSKFYFRYKPEMLSMCGIRRTNLKRTVLSLYTNIPSPLLLNPERKDFVKEQTPNLSYPDQFNVRYIKHNAHPQHHDSKNQAFDMFRRRN